MPLTPPTPPVPVNDRPEVRSALDQIARLESYTSHSAYGMMNWRDKETAIRSLSNLKKRLPEIRAKSMRQFDVEAEQYDLDIDAYEKALSDQRRIDEDRLATMRHPIASLDISNFDSKDKDHSSGQNAILKLDLE